ncbi:class I SAM-dependent methyltransferase [Bowmanella dokdonensis]|uniref:Class I SAM-dependent methyltransferase n=1 Tax=Bowmanella dokdonensis TaxID=751969 RepID=A0A939DRH2_9ALTE|nr:class I SAM-dependent methyltransferase [Bowmanella dokdonensis]MBN7827022.1 class I SAM-dependent methyltransferase [Bowmanella dokdonensis]
MKENFLDWSPSTDSLLKVKERELHAGLHSHISENERTADRILANRQFRIDALERILKEKGIRLKGEILEVGAGDGWCSAYIAKTKKEVRTIYTMECNEPAVTKLIPQTFQLLGIPDDKVVYVLGSFNNIVLKDKFDFVVAMGALHHSSNLKRTLSEIYSAIKPGGFLIAQEPYMADQTPNAFYYKQNDIEKNFNGYGRILNKERSDTFFRKCEYYAAGYHSGFDVSIIEIDQPIGPEKPANLILSMEKVTSEIGKTPVTTW